MQQNMYFSTDDDMMIENKVILLYLIDKMDIPLSNSQIIEFAVTETNMNHFSVQQHLTEMVSQGYLDLTQDNSTLRYTVTEDGSQTLDVFIKNISLPIKNKIIKYVAENRKIAKQDFEITANHFYDYNVNEYIVKCGVYEDEIMLMELNMSVVSKEQALNICNNWKHNVTHIYGDVLNILLPKARSNAL